MPPEFYPYFAMYGLYTILPKSLFGYLLKNRIYKRYKFLFGTKLIHYLLLTPRVLKGALIPRDLRMKNFVERSVYMAFYDMQRRLSRVTRGGSAE